MVCEDSYIYNDMYTGYNLYFYSNTPWINNRLFHFQTFCSKACGSIDELMYTIICSSCKQNIKVELF